MKVNDGLYFSKVNTEPLKCGATFASPHLSRLFRHAQGLRRPIALIGTGLIANKFSRSYPCLGDLQDGIVASQLQGDGRGARVSICVRLQIAAPGSLPLTYGKLSETFCGAVPGSCAATRRCRRPYNSTARGAATIVFHRWGHPSEPESRSR